ncbi:hypothetical protein IDH44_24290 [Paenibacillus sp. IB182496]|uniref:Uncharacterized protein n=1 Tax=Paenibacillus sabuli TaxID=2772509 RepID=A0A927GV26_9BACL|nr:hypothetical protein [Paenibacillus sabuli]MBD2848312.1 hypothetical protein [Paenibacillus sabuli]
MANLLIRDTEAEERVYFNGQVIVNDCHFDDHVEADVPVQIYLSNVHQDIGFIEQYCSQYVKINHTFYDRSRFTFVSRPGY